jgi:hypothetical protein
VKRSLQGALLASAFIATQVLAGAGCNAILGNGYGVDDGTNGGLGPDGGGNVDPDAPFSGGEGGGGGDGGGPGNDAMTTGEGGTLDANVDAACPMSICPSVLVAATGPQRLVLDSSFVYWTTATGVGRIGTSGASGTMTFKTVGLVVPSSVKRGVALANGNAYVTVADRGATICAPDLSSCNATGFLGLSGIASSVTADSAKVEVGIFDDTTASHGGTIFHASVSGASPTAYTGATGQVVELRGLAGKTYFMSTVGVGVVSPTIAPTSVADLGGELPSAFDVKATGLVVATNKGIRLCTTTSPTVMCPTTAIQLRTAKITAIAFDGPDVIWAENSATGGAIYRAAPTPGAALTLLADTQGSVLDIAVDLKSIYWTSFGAPNGAGGAIMQLGK